MAVTAQRTLETADDNILSDQLERLFDALHGVDDISLGPVERSNMIAITAMLRLRARSVFKSDDIERLASSLASVIAKSEQQRTTVINAALRVFQSSDAFGPSVDVGAAKPDRFGSNAQGQYPVKAPLSYSKQLIALAALCATAIALFAALQYQPAAPVRNLEQAQGETSKLIEETSKIRVEAAATPQQKSDRPLTREEINGVVKSIVDAAQGARSVSLWQLSLALARPGDPIRERMPTFKMLQLHAALPTEAMIDFKNADRLERLVWAYLYIDQPGRLAAATDVKSAAQATAQAFQPTASAAPTPLPVAEQTYFAPWWLFGAALTIPLFGAGIWRAGYSGRKRRHVERVLVRSAGRVTSKVATSILDPAPLERERKNLSRVARHLLARAQIPTPNLDVERTIAATIEQAGLFTPRRAMLRVTPEYLALIATQGPDDQEADRLSYIVEEIRNQELNLERRYLEHDADRVFTNADDARATLASVHSDCRDHRLIVLGSGEGFLDEATFQPKPWTEAFQLWNVRALATPVPPEEWGIREARLSGLFDGPLFHSTARGLEAMAVYLRDRADAKASAVGYQAAERRSWRFDTMRWMTEAPYLEDGSWSELWPELQNYLGVVNGDRRGIDWLASVAIYPAIRWDLTAYLGLRLQSENGRGAKTVLYDDEIVTRLSVLPWFRAGHMPAWVRRRLIAEIPPKRRREIIKLIGELLVSQRPASSDALTVKLPIATEGTAAGEISEQSVRTPDDDLAAHDRELLKLLESEPRADLLLEGKKRSLRGFFAGLTDNFRGHESAWSGLLLLYLAGAIWLAPKPWAGPASTGSWWGIALLALGLATGPWAARIAKSATAAADDSDREPV